MRAVVLAGMMAVAASAAVAHPHLFIDVRVEVKLDDQNRATAVRIGWEYDELFSLSTLADKGLDPDGDDALTSDEMAQLNGFDMEWIPDYPGDTYALLGDAELGLSGPRDWTTEYVGGRIRTTHWRDLAEPVAIGAGPFLVQVYDPGFYTAYAIVGDPVLTGGAGCMAEVWGPDIDAADEALKAALSEYSASEDVEQDFPAIGKAYAEEVRVTCAAP